MRVLHILTGGHAGGIETLCREIGRKSVHKNGFCFMSFGGEIYEQMTELGLITYPLFKCGKKWSFRKLTKILRIAEEYDIIVVHHEDLFMELYFLIAIFIKRIPGVRYVHSCYSDEMQLDTNNVKRGLKRVMRQCSISASCRIIFVSKAGKNSCKKTYYFDDDKSRIIYNGIADKYLVEGKAHFINVVEPLEILYVGRLEAIKGLDCLLKVVARLKEDFSIHLSLVGNGEQRNPLQKLADDLQLMWEDGVTEGCDVTFYGVQTDIIPFLKRAVLFVYPSACQEIFGISIVEAMAFGIPCIGNQVGGIPEIIINGKNGFLSKTADVDGLYGKIKLALETIKDKDMLGMISDEAKKTARRFNVENTCQQLDAEFDRLRSKV